MSRQVFNSSVSVNVEDYVLFNASAVFDKEILCKSGIKPTIRVKD